MSDAIQPMPDLTPEQDAALRADIKAHGVRVPVVEDQHGRILDGNNRVRIAAELGIDYPVEVVVVADDDEALDIALSLNLARRHLSREQVRDLIRAEISRRPGDSDRAIARRFGCSPSTVGAVRKGDLITHSGIEVSKLDTPEAWQPPEDVDLQLRAAVLEVYDDTNLTPELPTTDAAYRWCRNVLLQDSADPPIALMILWASDVDPIGIATSITGRMALWKARGMDRDLIRSLHVWWLDLTLSEQHRARAREAQLFGGKYSDELLEACLRNVGSVPLIPAELGGEGQ